MKDHTQGFLELIRRCSTDLPKDVEDTMRDFAGKEEEGSLARSILMQILENCRLAREQSRPLCQDTGTNVYWIDYPSNVSEKELRDQIVSATKLATERIYLRPNSVDSLTGKNTGNNVGAGHPYMHFHQWDEDHVRVRLMLKGGGCENCGAQYKLPDSRLHAGRDLDGVARCVRDAVLAAQGRGCAPGIIGVCIGGDRGSSHEEAKLALMRKLGDTNPVPELDRLEKKLVDECNSTGIGPMGLGGVTTVLDVKMAARNRIPASFFVSISYICWACRRYTMTIKGDNVSYD